MGTKADYKKKVTKMLRLKPSTCLFFFLLNLNLFVVQYVVFITWYRPPPGSRPDRDLVQVDSGGQLMDSDEVLVYSDRQSVQSDEVKTTRGPDERPGNKADSGHIGEGKSSWDWNWDRRSQTKPKAQRFLYLVRHGQYYGSGPYEKHLSPLGNKSHFILREPSVNITQSLYLSAGKVQAQKIGERLKSMNVTFHKFMSSTSIRAAESADVIHRCLTGGQAKYAAVDDVVRRSVAGLEIEYSDELRDGFPTFPDPPSPGMFNRDDPIFDLDMPRIRSTFSKFVHRAEPSQTEDSNEVVVTHGNIIAYFVLRSLQLPAERWLKVGILQGSITLLQLHPNGDVSLRMLGDVGHIAKKDWSG